MQDRQPVTPFPLLVARIADTVRQCDPAAVCNQLDAYLVVDVREPAEVLLGYLPGAVHVPRGLLEARAAVDPLFADYTRPILVYSGRGERSVLATDTLGRLGYQAVESLRGGFLKWQELDLPID